jgi:hypothetical protein
LSILARADILQEVEITSRTFFRHFFMFCLLVAALYLLNKDTFIFWIRAHFIFLLCWSALIILAGASGDKLARWYQTIKTQDPQLKESPLAVRLFRLWISCSRCAGFWMGGAISIVAGMAYFPMQLNWYVALVALYLFLSGASLAAAVAVGLTLYHSAK